MLPDDNILNFDKSNFIILYEEKQGNELDKIFVSSLSIVQICVDRSVAVT